MCDAVMIVHVETSSDNNTDSTDSTDSTDTVCIEASGTASVPIVCLICSDEIADNDIFTVDDLLGDDILASMDDGAQHPVRGLKCDHHSKFHRSCLKQWTVHKLKSGESASCPLCRVEYAKSRRPLPSRRARYYTTTASNNNTILDRFNGFKYAALSTLIVTPLFLLVTPVDLNHVLLAVMRAAMLLGVILTFHAIQYYQHYRIGVLLQIVSLCCAICATWQGYVLMFHTSSAVSYRRCYFISFSLDIAWTMAIFCMAFRVYYAMA